MTPTTKKLCLAALLGLACGAAWFAWLRPGPPVPPAPPAAAARPAVPPPLQVSLPEASLVRQFIGRSGSMEPLAAVRFLAGLPDSLDHSEQAALANFVRDGLPGLGHIAPSRRHHIANDAMSACLRQADLAPGLIPALAAIASDQGGDAVVRDYALQAIGRWLSDPAKLAPNTGSIDPAADALLAAAADRAWISSGTALIALDHACAAATPAGADANSPLARRQGEFLQALDASVRDPGAHPLARTSAFQIAARRARPGLADDARRTAADVAQPPALRASALAALGLVGDPVTDAPLLEQLTAADHLQVSAASRAALAKLSE